MALKFLYVASLRCIVRYRARYIRLAIDILDIHREPALLIN